MRRDDDFKVTMDDEIMVKDLISGYLENEETNEIRAWAGKLDVRPAYQRGFVYKEKNLYKRDAVIDTILNGFPLSVFYWVDRENGRYEVLDGQQRIMSICQYSKNEFSIPFNGRQVSFKRLLEDEERDFLNYPLMVYFCRGTQSKKLKWFRRINVAGEPLNDQELLNASYAKGKWLGEAKKIFSKPKNNGAYNKGRPYVNGTPIRQDILRTAIKWINDGDIKGYMEKHEMDTDAEPLRKHYYKVIDWVIDTFGEDNKRTEMKYVDWGTLYKEHHKKKWNAVELEKQVAELMTNKDIKNKKGIYPYVLDGNEKHLKYRDFEDEDKRVRFEEQKGKCAYHESSNCKAGDRVFDDYTEMHADHIKPWDKGGETELDNLQLLCATCNITKGNRG